MIKDFNVSGKGHGSYWLLGILRWVMVLIFISFGIQKFTPESAQGIALYISNSPFVSWLSIFGIRGEAYLLGIIELTTAAILAAGAFVPILSALGSLMGIGTFAITWSFFFTTPGVVKWSISTDPIAWNLTGEFLYKDIVLLCVCIVLFLASLPRKPSRFGRIDVLNLRLWRESAPNHQLNERLWNRPPTLAVPPGGTAPTSSHLMSLMGHQRTSNAGFLMSALCAIVLQNSGVFADGCRL
jgi:uncharacterized membrane protein YkgB